MQNRGMPTPKKSAPARGAAATRKKSPQAQGAGQRGPQPTRLAGTSGEPLWRQLVQALREDIIKGVFRVGVQLPTEEELCERFAVSRHTVRVALQQLRADGLVSSRQGSGTTVMAPPPSTPFNVHQVASIDELIAYAAESRYVVDRAEVIESHQVSPDELPLPEKRSWLRLQGFRLAQATEAADTPPVCWTEVFVAAEFAGVERLLPRRSGPIWQLIEDMYGERLVDVEQSLRVRTVPAQVAAGLDVDPASSVVEVRRTYRTSSDQVAEVSVNLYPAEKFRFNMKLRRA